MADHLTNLPRDQKIVDLARRQRGLVTSRQLAALGVGRRTLDRWVASGRLWRAHRGVYVLGPQPLTRRGRWLAAVMARGPEAVLSHASAAALWGLAADRREVDVTAPGGRRGLNGSGIRLHVAKFARDEWLRREGIPVTTVARTLFDLAEAAERPQLESAWDEAGRLRLLHAKQVAMVCERHPTRPACRRIRPLLATRLLHDDERRRSPLEDRFAAFVRAYRLPPPQANVLVGKDEVDALWPGSRLIVELDSWEFHAHRAAFERDRNRDADHLLAGYRTIRVTHRRLDQEPAHLAAQIRTLLGAPDPQRA
jgi:very-short-patch-repair endonuclease